MTSFMIDESHFLLWNTTNSIKQGHVWEAYGSAAEQKIPTFYEPSESLVCSQVQVINPWMHISVPLLWGMKIKVWSWDSA